MNIVEAYIKFKGQLIIIISGISGCGKSSLANKFSKNFKIKHLELFDYFKKNFQNETVLPDGTKINNFNTDDAIDWDLFNSDVNNLKKNGLIISGMTFPNDKINFEVDFHLHLSISKQLCSEKRIAYLEKHKEEYEEEYKMTQSPSYKLYINHIVYPYYKSNIENMSINKFLNANNMTNDEIWDNSWDIIINFINKKVYLLDNNSHTDDELSTSSYSSSVDRPKRSSRK